MSALQCCLTCRWWERHAQLWEPEPADMASAGRGECWAFRMKATCEPIEDFHVSICVARVEKMRWPWGTRRPSLTGRQGTPRPGGTVATVYERYDRGCSPVYYPLLIRG